MNRKRQISLWAASLEIGGYPELLLNLARQHGLEIHVKGRARYLDRQDLEDLGRHVREWLSRPRMSRQLKTPVRGHTRLARRRGEKSSDVI